MNNILKIKNKIRGNLINSDTFGPAIRVFILMLIVTGIAYPLVVLAIGQGILPFQSNGSLVTISSSGSNEREVGSILIAQDFNSPKFFHPRIAADSASGVDPHITPENAFTQIANVSKATGISNAPLRTLIELNIERNRAENLLAFAPKYVNVLEVNLELVKQYPEIYSEFLTEKEKQILLLQGDES